MSSGPQLYEPSGQLKVLVDDFICKVRRKRFCKKKFILDDTGDNESAIRIDDPSRWKNSKIKHKNEYTYDIPIGASKRIEDDPYRVIEDTCILWITKTGMIAVMQYELVTTYYKDPQTGKSEEDNDLYYYDGIGALLHMDIDWLSELFQGALQKEKIRLNRERRILPLRFIGGMLELFVELTLILMIVLSFDNTEKYFPDKLIMYLTRLTELIKNGFPKWNFAGIYFIAMQLYAVVCPTVCCIIGRLTKTVLVPKISVYISMLAFLAEYIGLTYLFFSDGKIIIVGILFLIFGAGILGALWGYLLFLLKDRIEMNVERIEEYLSK